MNPLLKAQSLGDISRIHARLRPDHTALIFEDEHLDYKTLDATSSQAANGLVSEGLRPNQRICYLGTNTHHYFELILAASKACGVMCPINWRLSVPEIIYIVENAQASIIFVTKDFLQTINQVLPHLSRLLTVVNIDDYEAWRDQFSRSDPEIDCRPDDDVIQLYTSGTTGHPKGVRLSNRALLTTRARELDPACPEWTKWYADDISLISMPCFHMGGTNYGLSTIYAGATGVITSQFDPQQQVDLVLKYGITKQFIVPTALKIMLNAPSLTTSNVTSLKFISYGSSPIPLDLMEASISKFGCGFVQKYGMTETGGSCTALAPDDHTIPANPRMNSVGKPLKGVEIRIVNKHSDELPQGQSGEILVKNIGNMNGYWQNDAATNETCLPGGWLRTGDAGYMDEDGYLYILDRIKDMIVSGGENIYSAEVERALRENPSIAEVAVIGVPDEKWGEAVKACVVIKTDKNQSELEIIADCKTRIAKFKSPKTVDFVKVLPRNAAGKVLKTELRAPYWTDKKRAVN